VRDFTTEVILQCVRVAIFGYSFQVQQEVVAQIHQWLNDPPIYETLRIFQNENLFVLISRIDYDFYM
jgi:hypothetical protein